MVKGPAFASSGRFISIPLMERGEGSSHRRRTTNGQLECHCRLCAALMGRRFGSGFVTLSFVIWPPLFSAPPHPLLDLDLTWVPLAFARNVRHLAPWIVTRNYCCSGSRYCPLPSVDWDCNCRPRWEWSRGRLFIRKANVQASFAFAVESLIAKY